MPQERSELGEGLYWMAEKLCWGYEGEAPDQKEAFRLYQQSSGAGLLACSFGRIRDG